MPPPIVASHTYRCADGGLLYVDFLQDGTSINVRRQRSGPVLRLSTPAQGLAYVGDGMNLTVSGKEVRIDEPKKARSEEHTSELQSLMRISYAVFCLKKKKTDRQNIHHKNNHKTTKNTTI